MAYNLYVGMRMRDGTGERILDIGILNCLGCRHDQVTSTIGPAYKVGTQPVSIRVLDIPSAIPPRIDAHRGLERRPDLPGRSSRSACGGLLFRWPEA